MQQNHVQFRCSGETSGSNCAGSPLRAMSARRKRASAISTAGYTPIARFSRAPAASLRKFFRASAFFPSSEKESSSAENHGSRSAARPRKIVDVRRHAVSRENRQPFAPRIEKTHHRPLVRDARSFLPACAIRSGNSAPSRSGDVRRRSPAFDPSSLPESGHALASAITHSRCTTPYSSRISVAGAPAASASVKITSMRRCASEYSIKSWPVCVFVCRKSSSRSAFGPERVCSCRKTTPAE